MKFSPSVAQIVDQLIDLRLKSYCITNVLKSYKINRARVHSVYFPFVTSAVKEGRAKFYYKNKRLRAAVIFYTDERSYPGFKSQMIFPDLDIKDAQAVNWVLNEIKILSKKTQGELGLNLGSGYRDMIKPLEDQKFFVSSVVLVGKVQLALKFINQIYSQTVPDVPHRKMISSDLSSVLAIYRSEFKRNPQFGWFISSPEYLKKLKSEIAEELLIRGHRQYVFCDGEKTVGHFMAGTSVKTPYGLSAGLSVVLKKEYQRKGLIKTVYLVLLRDLSKAKVPFFRGGTSQSTILKLAELMGRVPVGYMLRYQKCDFNRQHFGLK